MPTSIITHKLLGEIEVEFYTDELLEEKTPIFEIERITKECYSCMSGNDIPTEALKESVLKEIEEQIKAGE